MIRQRIKNDMPIFFLITCVKDGRKYIGKLFESLLNQTKINFIHYIYDDGSSDPIEDLVYEYKEKASRLLKPYEVIYEKNPINIGITMSTQHCISQCNLPYFIWIDCDNWIDKDFFKELEKTVIKHPDSIMIRSALDFYCYDQNNSLKLKISYKHSHLSNNYHKFNTFFYKTYLYGFFAVNNDLYREINPTNYFLVERNFFPDDQVIFICLIMSKRNFCFSEKALGHALSRNDSESHLYKELDRDMVYNNYLTLCRNVNEQKITNVCSIKYLLDSYDDMINCYYSNKPFDAFHILLSRKKFLKEQELDRTILYKKYNTIIWFFLILLKTIKRKFSFEKK